MIKINDAIIFRIHVKYLSARIAELARGRVQSNMQPLPATFSPQCIPVPQSSDAFM